MTKTVVIHDVPPSGLQQVLNDLKSEGYNTSYYLEPDGNFTVVGTKEVPAPNGGAAAASSTQQTDASAKARSSGKMKPGSGLA